MNTKIFLLIALLSGISLTSCEDYFGDVNEDPNNPLSVSADALLPAVQVRMAYLYNGDAARYLGINSQTVDGVGRQFVVFQNYGLQPTDVDNMWSVFYTGILNDTRLMQDVGTNHYKAAGDIIRAWSLLCMTDWWGDIPYSESFQPLQILQPGFDSQEQIFTTIYGLLDNAVATLEMPEEEGIGLTNGAFNALMSWTSFAHSIEARARLHQANRTGDYAAVLAALDKGAIADPINDVRIEFAATPTNTAPWYQYIEQRDDTEVGATYVGIVEQLQDPRLNSAGQPFDVSDRATSYSHPIYTRDRNVPIMTFVEMKFIEAEAAFRDGNMSRAYDAFLAGLNASLEEHKEYYQGDFVIGTDTSDVNSVILDDVNTAYVAQVDPGMDGLTLEQIMTQKYVALYTDPETFSDWRRTGIPALTPNTGTEIPRRLPYPQTETVSNENTPSQADVTQFSRVWWDE